jgi:DNA-binding NarL/FixJ family response regulator
VSAAAPGERGSGAQARAILVIDDHQLVGSSLILAMAERGLRGHSCRVTTVAGILDCAMGFPPGVALLDLDLRTSHDSGSLDELEVVAGLRARGWSILVLSAETDQRRIAAAIGAGATGFIPKSSPLPELLDTVAGAAAGRAPFAPEVRERWLQLDRSSRAADRRDRTRWRRLTAREREVLEHLAYGERATVIAEHFVVSLTTVRAQIRSILAKLDVNSQLEAVALLHRVRGTAAPRHDETDRHESPSTSM